MPTTGMTADIVIKGTDLFSDAMKTMSNANKSFSKDLDGLQSKLNALNKTKAVLKVDVDKARADLKVAEKNFAATGDAASKLELESKQLTLENARRNLSLTAKEASLTEKEMIRLGNALSKTENRAGGGSGAVHSIVTAIAATGAGQILGDVALNVGNAWAGSALGAEGAAYVSNALSYAATGAALGSAIGPPGVGMAIGAGAGALIGIANGFVQNSLNEDEAFKTYVQESYETALSGQETALTSGSAIAGSREQTQMAFSKKLGGDEAADAYLEQVKTMARDTNYTYDEITGYSKLLLNTYDTEKTLTVLKTLSDASAGLNLGSSDVEMFIAGLSRMRTTGKTTQEYLNYFSERGVDVYQALAEGRTGDDMPTDKSEVAELVTAGKIEGADAAEYILEYIDRTYGSLSEKLASTYDAMVDNLSDYQADLDAAMGAGYNEARKSGIEAQQTWMSGESGQALEGAYGMIGRSFDPPAP